MAAKNYIPSRDATFSNWLGNLVTYAAANAAALGLAAPTVTALTDGKTGWDTDFGAHNAAAQAARSARQVKAARRKSVEALVRGVVKQIQANAAVTDAQKEALGITVPKSSRTPVPVPTSRPVPQLEEIEAFTHTLRIADDAANRFAKPDGVETAEVWLKIVPQGQPAPADPADLEFAGLASATRLTKTFDAADAGKTAYYRMRWVNTKGETGPWGSQIAGTIAA